MTLLKMGDGTDWTRSLGGYPLFEDVERLARTAWRALLGVRPQSGEALSRARRRSCGCRAPGSDAKLHLRRRAAHVREDPARVVVADGAIDPTRVVATQRRPDRSNPGIARGRGAVVEVPEDLLPDGKVLAGLECLLPGEAVERDVADVDLGQANREFASRRNQRFRRRHCFCQRRRLLDRTVRVVHADGQRPPARFDAHECLHQHWRYLRRALIEEFGARYH